MSGIMGPRGGDGIPASEGRKPAGRGAYIFATVILLLCVAAFALRDELRGRYWAGRVVSAANVEERAAALDRVCRLGDSGRWGIEYLLAQEDGELRQFGYLALHSCAGEWVKERFYEGLADGHPYVREFAALGVAQRTAAGDVDRLEVLIRRGGAVPLIRGSSAALERMGDPEALAALHRLARESLGEEATAAVIDALATLASPESVPVLLERLADQRVCATPPRYEALALDAALAMTASPDVEAQSAMRTIADRAGAALARITGIPTVSPGATDSEPVPAGPAAWRAWWNDHSKRESAVPEETP